jgi:hypothetical protein
MKALIVAATLSIVFFTSTVASQLKTSTGTIMGRVIDAESKLELLEAHIQIKGGNAGTATDTLGKFVVKNVPVGSYSLLISAIGYETFVKTDIVVRTDRITFVNVEMMGTSIELAGTTASAGYFQETQSRPVSSINFSSEEIRRSPGAAGDVSRIIFGLPSLAKINDSKNSLIVRGGSPVENGFFLDNIEIPNINHFPTQGSTDGPIGILNVDFVEDMNFSSGGFGAAYGDKLSSIMELKLREGNRSATDVQLDMSMQGFGGTVEGPLNGGRGSYFISARRSYLDLITGMLNMRVGVPIYSDVQGKAVYDLSANHKLSFIDVYSTDALEVSQKNALDGGSNIYPVDKSYSNTGGMNWQWIWGQSGFSNTSIAHTYSNADVRYIQTRGEKLLLTNSSTEQEWKFRNVNHWMLNDANKFNFGFNLKYNVIDYSLFFNDYQDLMGNKTPAFVLNRAIRSPQAGVFLDYAFRLANPLTVSPGGRVDYYEYNDEVKFSPRLSIAYQFSENTSLTAAYGMYYQKLPWIIAAQNSEFRSLKTPRADHVVLSFNHLLTESTKLTCELYEKIYRDFPMDATQPGLFLFDEAVVEGIFLNHEHLVSSGEARSRGVEVTVQKKMADDIYGLIACSYFNTNYTGSNGKVYDRVYDNKVTFAAEGGYKLNEKWEFSLRWLYAGGAPMTPFDEPASLASHKGVFDATRINGAHLPDFHSLNLRVDKRYYFQSTTLTAYLSIWNAYGRRNIAAYHWDEIRDKVVDEKMWGTVPVFGVKYEF